jgi:hypothetical protein
MPRLLFFYLFKRIGLGVSVVQLALSVPVVLSYWLYQLPPAAVRGGLSHPALDWHFAYRSIRDIANGGWSCDSFGILAHGQRRHDRGFLCSETSSLVDLQASADLSCRHHGGWLFVSKFYRSLLFEQYAGCFDVRGTRSIIACSTQRISTLSITA